MAASYLAIWLFVSGVLLAILLVVLMVNHSRDRGQHQVAKGLQMLFLAMLMAYAYVAFNAFLELLSVGLPTEGLFFGGRELTFIQLAYIGALIVLAGCIVCVPLGFALALRKSWARVIIQAPLLIMAVVHLIVFVGLSLQFGLVLAQLGGLGMILFLMPVVLGVGGIALYRSPLAKSFFGAQAKSNVPESLDAMMMDGQDADIDTPSPV